MTFEILPHTADIRLRVTGKNYEELFKAGLLGMKYIFKKNKFKIIKKIKRTIKISSFDYNALFVDFLNRVLYESQIRKEIYFDVKFKKLFPNLLEAEICGSKLKYFDEDIKAVTYHEMEIKKRPDGLLETIIIFDI